MRNIQLELILAVVCRYYGVTVHQIKSRRRDSRLVIEARHVYIYVAREVTGYFFHDIAPVIDRKQFNTIKAYDKIATQRRIYKTLNEDITELMERISNDPMIMQDIDLLKIAIQNTAD